MCLVEVSFFVSQGMILGVVLFPVRITLATLFFLLMWPIARLRLAGLSVAERAEPVRGWRWWLFHHIMLFLSRAVFFFMGFLWIRVKGRQAGVKEAPVLVVAPHSGSWTCWCFARRVCRSSCRGRRTADSPSSEVRSRQNTIL